MRCVIEFRILAALLLVGVAYAAIPLKPGTPVTDFRVPLFNEEGYRVWFLRGEKGIYESETQIKIEDMEVSQYTGNDADRRIAVLTSPQAIFHFDSTSAYGPGTLHIQTDAFEVSGEDWVWTGKEKEIIFNRDVKVVLYEGIGDILK